MKIQVKAKGALWSRKIELPKIHQQVSFERAREAGESKQLDKRVKSLLGLDKRYLLNPDQTLLLYEQLSWFEELPSYQRADLPTPLERHRENPLSWVSETPYYIFEAIRRKLEGAGGQYGLALPFITEATNSSKAYWPEAGAIYLEGLMQFLEIYDNFELFEKPSEEASEAGVDRLQAFGSYVMIQEIAERYKVLPREIERESASFVFKDWALAKERAEYDRRLWEVRQAGA